MSTSQDWSDYINGMVSALADDDAFLVQDASDTTESPEGTTKGVLVATMRAALGGGGSGGGGGLLAANNLSELTATAATARANLGLIIGTNVQAQDSDLAAIAALTTTSFGRGILALADAAALRASAGLDADLGTFSVPASTTISTFGATIVDDVDAITARATLGLGTAATTAVSDYATAVNTRVECIWTGSTWTTNAGAAVPTSASLIRTYNSQNDASATTPPGPYNVRDMWNGRSA